MVHAYNPSSTGGRDRSTTVLGQSSKELARSYLKNQAGDGCTCLKSQVGSSIGGLQTQTGPKQKHEALSENKTKEKRARAMAQVIKYLPSKFKTLYNSNFFYLKIEKEIILGTKESVTLTDLITGK
jgi:hypothetical protein